VVTQGSDDNVCPEARPVLAYAPILVLEASVPRRRFEFPLGKSCRYRFRRIELPDGVSDYLACGVALYALGALVPARYAAVRVEQENGVVGYALHEQGETLLRVAQRISQGPGMIDFPGHLGEAGCLAFSVAHGADYDMGPEAGTVLAHAP